MTQENSRSFSSGVNQSGVRDYNERLLLSMIQRLGPMPGSDMARQSNLSAQTVSVILRSLEADGLLIKGAPQRLVSGHDPRHIAFINGIEQAHRQGVHCCCF